MRRYAEFAGFGGRWPDLLVWLWLAAAALLLVAALARIVVGRGRRAG